MTDRLPTSKLRLVVSLLCLVASGCLSLSLPDVQAGSVSGFVTNKDAPMPSVTLTLTPESGAAQTATTGSDGSFRVTNLQPGVWTLSATVTGYLPLEKTFSVTAGQTRELGELRLYAESGDAEVVGTVSGTVHVNGVDQALVQGGTIEALVQPTMALIGTTSLGASGLFAMSLPPGTYTLRATHPAFVTAMNSNVEVISHAQTVLPDNALVLDLNPGRINGVVLKEVDGSSSTVPAANVTIFSDSGSSTVTASDGTFSLGGLPGGARTLTFSGTNLHLATSGVQVQVTPGDTTNIADVTLFLDRGDIAGTVVMGDGSALADVTVYVDGTSYSAQAVPSGTPATGTFRISQVPVGTYTLSAQRTGYRIVSSGSFTVLANQTVTVPTLPSLTRVQGDFVIDDLDPTNTPGFTHVTDVVLFVNSPSQVAAWRAAEVDPSVANLPFQPFGADGGTGVSFTLSSGDGSKLVYLQLQDAQGALGPVLTASIVLDTAPPNSVSLSLASGAAFTNLVNPLPFTLLGADSTSGLASMRLSLDAGVDASGNLNGPRLVYQRDSSFTRPTSTEGPVTVWAQVADNAGNVSAPVSASIIVDATAPSSGTAVIQRGIDATDDGFTNSPLVQVQVTAPPEPNGGTLRIRLANTLLDLDTATPAAVTSSVAWFLDASSDGAKNVWYRFVDSAGNQGPAQSTQITLDRVAPVPLTPAVSLATLVTSSPTNASSGALAVTVSDDRKLSSTQAALLSVAGVETALPPTSTTTFTGQLPFSLPAADGVTAVRVRFRDAAGNITNSTDFSLEKDTVAPAGSLTLTGALADGTASTSLTANATVQAAINQVGATGVYLTTSALSSCPSSAGSYVSPFDPSLLSFSLGATSGTATVSGCLRDAAGNTATLTPKTMSVDITAPSSCALSLSGTRVDGSAAPAGNTASASVTASIAGCSETIAEVSVVEAASPPSCTNTGSYAWRPVSTISPLALSTADGSKTLRGCVRDAARNVGSLAAATIALDTTPPTGASVVINNDAQYLNASQLSGGAFNLSLSGTATGATEWATDVTATPTNFLAYPANNPRSYSLPQPADGTVRLYARFRDAVGNEATVTDTIIVDTSAPAAPGITVTATGDVGFVNTQVTTLQLTGLSGVASMQLAESATSAAACNSTLSASLSQPPASVASLVLSATQGTHYVCAQTIDGAGNVSTIGSTSVVLDQIAPTRPVIITSDGYAALNAGDPFLVDISGPSTDANLKGYQRLGGTASTWTAVVPTGNRFSLPVQNDGSEEGYRNELRLRAVDRAGNASDDSSVLVTADTNAPEAAIVDPTWVDNANLRSTLYWRASSSNDVAAYEIYYDSVPTPPFSGAFANEGTSPVRVSAGGTELSETLSGLSNAASTWVQVIPVDRAGNRGPRDAGVIELQPNIVSPNLVASWSPPEVTHLFAETYFDGYLYVGGSKHTNPNSCSSTGDAVLLTYDVRRLVAPVQGGNINTTTPPARTGVNTFTSVFDCNANNGESMDIRVSPPWLFWAAQNQVYVFDLTVPSTPQLKTTLTLPAGQRIANIDVMSDSLFISTTASAAVGIVYFTKLSALYDNNSGTVPTWPGTDTGLVDAGTFNASAFITRNFIVNTEVNVSPWLAVKLDDALDGNTGTAWNLSDVWFHANFGNTSPYSQPLSHIIASGNYAYYTNISGTTQVLPLAPIWAGTPPSNSGAMTLTGVQSTTRFDVAGDELVTPDPATNQLRVYDVSTIAQPQQLTAYSLRLANTTHSIVFGNYSAVLTKAAPTVSIVELATPRGLHDTGAIASAMGARADVRAGFLVLPGSPAVFDLHGAAPSLVNDRVVNYCAYGVASSGDVQVSAYGTQLRVTDFELDLDRDPLTTINNVTACTSTASNDYCVSHPTAGVVFHDVAIWGNYLVALEFRNSYQELWLEVFDARPVKDHILSTMLALNAPVASLQVQTGLSSANYQSATLSMTQGVAIIAYQAYPGQPGYGGKVLAVSLRDAFDDNSATTLDATDVQANFTMPGAPDGGAVAPRMATLGGDTLYIATSRGVWAVAAGAITDNNNATLLDAGTLTGTYFDHAFDEVQVLGSSLIAAPALMSGLGQQQALVAFDMSASPTQLKPTGYLSLSGGTSTSCSGVGDTFHPVRSAVVVSGSRAYVQPATNQPSLHVIELE